MKPAAHVTGEEIIQELLKNLEQSLEPLVYSVLAPSVFDVYLHPDDLERFSGIVPQLVGEARRALDEHLQELKRRAQPGSLRRLLGGQQKQKEFKTVAGGWFISFLENADPDVNPGDILIESRLTLPPSQELGVGSRTRRISTLRSGGSSKLVGSSVQDDPTPPEPSARPLEPLTPAWQAAPAAPPIPETARFAASSLPQAQPPRPDPQAVTDRVGPAPTSRSKVARISWKDQTGEHSFIMNQTEIVVGRGGTGYWVDIRLETLPDVSRTHCKIRRDDNGRFFIKDVSAYGTTVNGSRLPPSIEQVGERKIDRNRETQLPPKARIGLADVLTIDFEVGDA